MISPEDDNDYTEFSNEVETYNYNKVTEIKYVEPAEYFPKEAREAFDNKTEE